MDYFENPRNRRAVPAATAARRGVNPLCGDDVELSVRIGEAEQIIDIGFDSRRGSILVASASIMTEFCQGLGSIALEGLKPARVVPAGSPVDIPSLP